MKKIIPIIVTIVSLAAVSCAKEQTHTKSTEVETDAVTGPATHISCRDAEISGKANPPAYSEDLTFGVLYSKSTDVLVGTATQIQARSFDSDFNYVIHTDVLDPETTYYYRSYFIQSGKVAYGNIKYFRTLALSSMIQTADASEINCSGAVLNGVLDLTDCKYDGLEYGFEVTVSGGRTHTVKSTNHCLKKFSAKDLSMTSGTNCSYVAYVKLDGLTYKGKTRNFTTLSFPSCDLGLSVKWATCNIGALTPEEYGRYFAYGDVVGQVWNGYWSGGGFDTVPFCELDVNANLKPEYDAAHVIIGGNWRMPTNEEQMELIDNCDTTWTENYKGTGVAGMIFTGKKAGYTDRSIFFPAAGGGYGAALQYTRTNGYYWLSTNYNEDYSWYFLFTPVARKTGYYYPHNGKPIRPVSD